MGSKTTAPAPQKPAGGNATSETLVITKEARLALEAQFLRTGKQKVAAIRAMFPYVHATTDQLIAAMYANADKNDDDLVVDTAARSTMNRALNVAKAWLITKAGDLVPEDNHDGVLLLLAQIVDIAPGALAAYQLRKAEWSGSRPEYGPVRVHPSPRAKAEDRFEPYDADVRYGSGEKADTVLAIVEGYLEQRVEHDGVEALLWLTEYRNGVVYASNEKRRHGAAHNKRAADARKGDGDGSMKPGKKQRGARNQGGTSKKRGKDEPDEKAGKKKAPAAPAKPRTIEDTPLRDVPTHALIVALTKRVVDYSVALTVEDARSIDELGRYYDKRFRRIPVGKTAAEVTKRGTVKRDKQRAVAPAHPAAPVTVVTASKVVPHDAVTPEAAKQNAINKGLVPWGTSAQINRALLTEQHAGRMTAKRRKEIVLGVMEGRITERKFRKIVDRNRPMALVG